MNISRFKKDQLVGQRLMFGFNGTELNEDLKFMIEKFKIGGLILFTDNIESPKQLEILCRTIQKFAISCGQPPLFISIDQEGGQVARLKKPFSEFPGNPKMKNDQEAQVFANTTASELGKVGINMNMAPVLDVAPKNIDSIMQGRSFGHDPQWVAKMGATVIDHLQQKNVMAVAKHFPGIGRTTLDSHDDLPHLDVDRSELESQDLVPFERAINQNVTGIMLSHVIYNTIDKVWPASLSPKIAEKILRKQLGFENIIITDDLDMGAIIKNFPLHTAIRQILMAGIDIALICHKGPSIENAYQTMLDHISTSKEMRNKCMVSVKRIMNLKRKYLSQQHPF